jgi:hypothetical protein
MTTLGHEPALPSKAQLLASKDRRFPFKTLRVNAGSSLCLCFLVLLKDGTTEAYHVLTLVMFE